MVLTVWVNIVANAVKILYTKRLTMKGITHEVFHFFTHLDKGLPYTLKKLIIAPGIMQREYIEGKRARYQKPFSMFFVSATFTALILYWISNIILKYYDSGNSKESIFFHQYWVLLQIIMMPAYALVTFWVFRDSKYNYAEITISQLYKFSALFLMLPVIHLFKFFDPELPTEYVEIPMITIYSLITNLNFFDTKPRWLLVLKSILVMCLTYFMARSAQQHFIEWFL